MWEPIFKLRISKLGTALSTCKTANSASLSLSLPETSRIRTRAIAQRLSGHSFMTVVSSSTSFIDLRAHSQMFPTEPPIKGKRKAEELNPLLNAAAAKRAKKDAAKLGASAKRKLTHEEAPNSLLIVRPQDSQPSQSQPTNHADTHPLPRFSSQPPTNSTLSHQPPSKKFKAGSQPPARPRGTSQTQARPHPLDNNVGSDVEVEKDVRAMDDEADKLRRLSRARTIIDPLLLASQTNVQFQSRPETSGSSRKGKSASKVVDITIPLPDEETPRIQRNKQLRSGAMSAITNGRNQELPPETPTTTPRGHRRKGSVSGRGKRVSSSFEVTGNITQPHNSVSESSFYKHIDADLPDPERIRQLLIWCSLRTLSGNPSSTSTDLPPLNDEALQLLKLAQEDVVRKLAEKKIDLSFYSSNSSSQPQGDLRENEQNVKNRMWEVSYTNDIQKAQAEEEAWKKVSYDYDAYAKKLQSSLEERTADLETDSPGLSVKAKGKRRATGDLDPESKVLLLEHELPHEFRPGLSLAKSILGLHRPEDPSSGGGRRGRTRTGMDREQLEADIQRLLPSLEFTIDQLYSRTSAAKTTTDITERMLNERFDFLNSNLASRIDPLRSAVHATAASGSQTTQLLSTYVGPSGTTKRPGGADPMDMMRALSRVDEERPPGQVGDAARRAVREVQRAGESGYVGGEKRLTNVPSTPRKTPGTPRRGNTPARGSTPGR